MSDSICSRQPCARVDPAWMQPPDAHSSPTNTPCSAKARSAPQLRPAPSNNSPPTSISVSSTNTGTQPLAATSCSMTAGATRPAKSAGPPPATRPGPPWSPSPKTPPSAGPTAHGAAPAADAPPDPPPAPKATRRSTPCAANLGRHALRQVPEKTQPLHRQGQGGTAPEAGQTNVRELVLNFQRAGCCACRRRTCRVFLFNRHFAGKNHARCAFQSTSTIS